MRDPFRSEKRSQLIREAQIGLSLVAIILVLFAYVAFHRIMGHGYHLPEHVRNAPISQSVVPGHSYAQSEQKEYVTPNEFMRQAAIEANSIPVSPVDKQAAEIKRRTHLLASQRNQPGLQKSFSKRDSDNSSRGPLPSFATLDQEKLFKAKDAEGMRTLTSRPKSVATLSPKATSHKPPVDSEKSDKPNVISLLESIQLPSLGASSKLKSDQSPKLNPFAKKQSGGGALKVKVVEDVSAAAVVAETSEFPKNELPIESAAVPPRTTKSSSSIFTNDLRASHENKNVVNDNSPQENSDVTLANAEFEMPVVNRTDFQTATSPKEEKFEARNSFKVESPVVESFVPANDRQDQNFDMSKSGFNDFEKANPPAKDHNTFPNITEAVRAPFVDEANDFAPSMISSKPRKMTNPQESDLGPENSNHQRLGFRASNQSTMARQQVVVAKGNESEDSRVYTVKEGDSFWSIAQDRYGDGRFFRVLFKYNEPTVVNFDNLVPGTKIGVPEMEDLFKLWPELCPKADSHQVVSTVGDSLKPRTYLTREGDTLFEIARQRLGQASRYMEIYEANNLRMESGVTASSSLPAGISLVLPAN